MAELEYNLKELRNFFNSGIRFNSLLNEKSPMHEVAKDCYDALLNTHPVDNKLYKNMGIKTLAQHLNKGNTDKTAKDTSNLIDNVTDIIIDDGLISMNPDSVDNDWYLNSPINLLLADRRNNGLNLYQPYLKPTGRLGDIAVIHSINPVGYKILPDAHVDLSTKLADVFDDNDLSCNVIIVDIGANADVSISEFIHAKNGTKIVKVLYLVREGATLNLDRSFDLNNKQDSLCILESQIIQFPGSTFNASIQSEGNNYNQDLMFIDVYKNCTTNIRGSHYLYGSNKNNSVVNVHHKGPNSTSRVDIRSVLEDNAYSSFLGEIKVDKVAEGVDADLKNKNLLCSPTATAFTEPQLDINTKEITCSHGCTISNIDKDTLYYLNSRGIDNVAGGDILKQCFLTQ
tara:strand:+ start:1908 stop:3107 length:1200 start_codon:yes stop_codon:yes gene_type:complete